MTTMFVLLPFRRCMLSGRGVWEACGLLHMFVVALVSLPGIMSAPSGGLHHSAQTPCAGAGGNAAPLAPRSLGIGGLLSDDKPVCIHNPFL